MRLLSAAVVAGLIAATASAQTMQPRVVPVQRAAAVPGFKVPDVPPPTVVPSLQSKQQRAVAVQKLLGLAAVPILGETTSLTPAAPAVPGKAELIINSASSVVGGNLFMTSLPASGTAVFHEGSSIEVAFSAGAGMRYAIDCRIDSSAKSIKYTEVGSGKAQGTVSVSSDGHALIALDKAPSASLRVIAMAHTGAGFIHFYGCEISPF